MAASRFGRILLWLAVLFLLFAGLATGGVYFATKALKSKVEAALGPLGAVGEIRVGFSAIEVLDVRIKAASGWPAGEELSAKRIVIEPDLAALVSRNLRVSQIHIEDAYLSMLRRKDGKLLLLPSLLAAAGEKKASDNKMSAAVPVVQFGSVSCSNCAIEFFDATVRQPALKLRLEQVNARLGKLIVPQLTGRTSIELVGVVKGVQRDGKVTMHGFTEIASRDSEITTQLRGVDLVTFQPYLIKASETGVRKGTLDLDLKSNVRNNRLFAPGTVTFSNMELSSGGSFMGMPRNVVVSMLKDKNGKISAKFVLDGNLNDPRFSLNEDLSGRIGSSVASLMGLSLEGVVKGLGTVGGGATKGLGDAINKLFGK